MSDTGLSRDELLDWSKEVLAAIDALLAIADKQGGLTTSQRDNFNVLIAHGRILLEATGRQQR